MALSGPDRTRLAKLLGMFGSDFEGEILNAARAAHQLVKRAGETWESVIVTDVTVTPSHEPPPRNRPHEPQRPRQEQPDAGGFESPAEEEFKPIVEMCLKHTDRLSEWEVEFLNSIQHRWSLTEKQTKALARIWAKIEIHEKHKDRAW
jgi:hypothetical protein